MGWRGDAGAGWLAAKICVVAGCRDPAIDERDPGEAIDVFADLPYENEVGGPAGDDECARSIPCVAGPSEGAATVRTAEDLASLTGVRCISGNLDISVPEVVDLTDLSSLEVVCGQVRVASNADLVDTAGLIALDPSTPIAIVDNPRLVRVTLPDSYAGRLRIEMNPSLQSLAELEALTSFDLFFAQNDAIVTFSLPNLRGGNVELSANAALDSVVLAGLTTGSISISANPKLTELSLPSLRQADSIEIVDSPALEVLDAPVLEDLDAFVLTGESGFTTIPALGVITEVGSVTIEDNPNPLDISWLASLMRIGTLRILRNSALDQAVAESVGIAVAESSKIGGNAGWAMPAMCPFTSDFECDEIDCAYGTSICAHGSDRDDCCGLGCSVDCPLPDGS